MSKTIIKVMASQTALIIATDFKPMPGGISEYTHNIAKHFQLQGDNVTVVTNQTVDAETVNSQLGYHVKRLNFPSKDSSYIKKLPKRFLLIYNTVQKIKPCYIFCTHYSILSLHCFLVSKIFQIPYFAAAHGSEINENRNIYKNLERKIFFKNTLKVFCVSEFTRKQVSRKLGVPFEKLVVVPNGVNLENFKSENRTKIRKRHKLKNKKILLTLCRLIERKGIDKVIEAMPEVLKKIPDTVYLIAGTGVFERHLHDLVKMYDLQEKVIFTGYVPESEKSEYYNACDVFIMPAREMENGDVEGFGIVFLEANACGKPVIGGLSGGMLDAIIDGETGLCVKPDDPKAISSGIIRLLRDEGYAKKLGSQGRQRVCKELGWNHITNRMKQEINKSIT